MNQIDLLKKIDDFFAKGIGVDKKEAAQLFLNENFNAKDYFYEQAPTEWVSWLFENGFFEVLNREAEDKTRYFYKLPELSYLARVAHSGEDQGKVVEVMLGVDCAKNFNPEVIDQFLRIAQELSPELLAKIIPKIKQENWVFLMKDFNFSHYSYDPLVKKLLEAKDYEHLILLAKAMLVVNKDRPKDGFSDKYFYLGEMLETGLFEALRELPSEHAVKGIELISGILTELVDPEGASEDVVFAAKDLYYLGDLDFFDLDFSDSSGMAFREDIKGLLKTYAVLIESALSSCGENARRIYLDLIKPLPDTQTIWRVKLFSMSRCPTHFSEELKAELYRIFTPARYSQLLFGTEYFKTIQKAFPVWSDINQRDYVKNIFDKFEKLLAELPNEYWHKEQGWEILSSIYSSLTPDEKKRGAELFGKELDETFKPEPFSPKITSGFVENRSPENFADYENVLGVIEALKGKLSSQKLKEMYKDDDLLKPRNIEGVGNALKEDIKSRISSYLAHSTDFLDSSLHVHYTYSFLRGIEEYLKENKLEKEDWDHIFAFLQKYISFEKIDPQDDDRWVARWIWVDKVIADILEFFLTKDYSDLFINKRDQVFDFIKYFLQSEDPSTKSESEKSGDLYTIAINSTRGKGFEDLVNFLYLDGEELKKDVLRLYEEVIQTAGLSVSFLIGRYLASFYYRDKGQVKDLFDQIFPREEAKLDRFLAVWEGYLSSPVYRELFEELKDYYDYALTIDASRYSERRRFKDLDEGLGAHLALGLAHFDEVKFTTSEKHPLLEKLWNSNDVKKQKAFISFLGRGIISHGNASEEWFKEGNIKLQKLKDFWEWVLQQDLDEEVYAAFGTWVNDKKDIFKDYSWLANMMARTLEKSKGRIEWDHSLAKRLPEFAAANPKDTLIILEKYLFGILGSQRMNWYRLDDVKISVYETLYKSNPAETKELINKLLENGGRPFWPLRKIVKD